MKNNKNNDFIYSVHKFMRSLQHADIKRTLPPPQMYTLIAIHKHEARNHHSKDGAYPSMLSKHLHFTRPAMTQTLNILEDEGYITRSIDENDRRKFKVRLTAKGKKIINKSCMNNDELINYLTDQLGEEKMQQTIDNLDEMTEILTNYNKER